MCSLAAASLHFTASPHNGPARPAALRRVSALPADERPRERAYRSNAVTKTRARIPGARLLSNLLSAPTRERRQLVVRDGGRTVVIPHHDIIWIEAEDYCARIHLHGRTLLVRESLRALGGSLDRAGFVRVHRSAIANVSCIREIQPLASGDQRLTLSDGTVLKISRTYRAHVIEAVGLTDHTTTK